MELVEIKKGETGTGLLIENDGYISINSTKHNKQIKESFDSNDEWYVPKPFIVDAVFQKYGVKNANGRVYPENILRREVEKYQERIKNHNAYGECYKPDAMILTETGWKTLEEVKVGENILTLNLNTNEIEIQAIEEKIEHDFDGEMVHIYNMNIDDVVTPGHEYIIFDRETNTFKYRKKASEILNKDFETGDFIPRSCFEFGNGHIMLDDMLNVETEHYKGKVMCVNVPNHTFYVMCNNKTHWTSNCNHPSESTIDLGRVSHNILELHWEGCTLVGKMELNISEGFRRYGVCSTLGDTCAMLLLNGYLIGVSSRAVGSVEQKLGVTIVGDDLEIICWDIVSDNSTPGAKISMNGPEELQQYIESKETNSTKSMISEKLNKLKGII